MSQQEALTPTLTPQETAAAARAAAEAATAAAATAAAATAAAAAASGVPSAPENESPTAADKPDENIAAEQTAPSAAPLTTEADDVGSRDAQQAVSLPDEKKADAPVDATMTAASAPMTDPSILKMMNQVNRSAEVSSAAALSSVSPGPTTSIQPQPSQSPAATHVPNLPSVISPIQKKSSSLTPFICDVVGCGKAFGKKFNLKAHRRVHTGDEPFLCSFPTCGKRFKWKSSLTFHEGLHLNAPEEPHPQTTAAELTSAAAAASTSTPNTAALDPTAAKKSGKV